MTRPDYPTFVGPLWEARTSKKVDELPKWGFCVVSGSSMLRLDEYSTKSEAGKARKLLCKSGYKIESQPTLEAIHKAICIARTEGRTPDVRK